MCLEYMEIRVSKRQSNKKYKTYYVNIPKYVLKKAPWLKKQKIVDIEVDVLGNIIIKPE